jgi:hypothetical protein
MWGAGGDTNQLGLSAGSPLDIVLGVKLPPVVNTVLTQAAVLDT